MVRSLKYVLHAEVMWCTRSSFKLSLLSLLFESVRHRCPLSNENGVAEVATDLDSLAH
jgi:hypothetical protein